MNGGTGNVSPDVINTNFVDMLYPSIQTINGHFFQGLAHILFYSCLGTMLNYSIIPVGPSLQITVVVHTVVLRLCNTANLRICS